MNEHLERHKYATGSLSVANEQHPAARVVAGSSGTADIILPHGRYDGEANDPADQDALARICFEMVNDCVDFGFGRAGVALVVLADEPEPYPSDTGEANALGRGRDACTAAAWRGMVLM